MSTDEPLRLLAIETTCDETGLAILEGERSPASIAPRIMASVVASQIALHERFGGVVPEIASRAHVRQVIPLLDRVLGDSGIRLDQIDAVAVATQPGLVGALVVGLTAAKTLAWTLGVPLIAVDHLEAHLFACQMARPEASVYPCVGLVVSGGHTSLYQCRGPIDSELLGGTIDDAAGEAFDKVASMLGLGYPGGPAIEKVARDGRVDAYELPRAFLQGDPASRFRFSFSGLKTAVLYAMGGQDAKQPAPDLDPQTRADLAASFQEAVVEVLVAKCRRALVETGLERLGVGGGVAANARLRERLQQMCEQEGIDLIIPPLALCTDNAAMLGVAFSKLAAGQVATLDIDITPGLVREPQTTGSRPNSG